jgi:hypothetical protein
MYTEYEDEIKEEDLLYEPSERTSDIQLPSVVNILLLGGWLVICLVGFAIIFFAKNLVLGITVIGIPTFFGMIIKPTFALCVMMLVLPTGAGVGYETLFSLDRGIGIALAVSFLLNLMVSRPSLHVRNKTLWVLVIYTIWIFFSSLAAPYVGLELRRAFTQFQLLTLVFIVYWILQTNGEKTFRWALRAYVIGTLGMIIIAYISGAAMISLEEESGRYAASLGRTIDANMLAALTSMAFLAAIYLFARDRNIFWRIIYLIAIVFLPLMVLRTGSRGGLIALVFTILSPLLFLRQVARKPALAALTLIIIIFAAGSTLFFVKSRRLEEKVETRLTDVQYAKSSLARRMSLIEKGIEAATKYPAGTGYLGWLERTGETHIPHNDFFFALGIHGIPAAMLFMFFVIMMMLTVKRIPLGLEKLYARAVLTFLLVMGLDIVQLYQKHFWIFLAFVMASERIAKLYMTTSNLETTVQYEEDSLMQHGLV